MIDATDAARVVQNAIKSAASIYEDWTNGWWLSDSGCESLIVATAAKAFAGVNKREDHGSLTLETPLRLIRNAHRSLPPGAIRHSIGNAKRADIVLWSKTEIPYGIIEIKRTQQLDGWDTDVEELTSLLEVYGLQTKGPVRFGIFGAFLLRAGYPNLDRAIEKIQKRTYAICNSRVNYTIDVGPKTSFDPAERAKCLVYCPLTICITRA
jgi:hypothetical protein